MKRSDFHFDLPPELIAQHPAPERDAARLLVVDRAAGRWSHHGIRELPELLPAGTVCVPNDVRVRHARLFLRRAGGGQGEALLLRSLEGSAFEALVRPGARLKPGSAAEVVDPESGAALARLRGLYQAIARIPAIGGVCYTQLTDVEQEVNGLMTFDRKPKFDVKEVDAINDLLGK